MSQPIRSHSFPELVSRIAPIGRNTALIKVAIDAKSPKKAKDQATGRLKDKGSIPKNEKEVLAQATRWLAVIKRDYGLSKAYEALSLVCASSE